MVNKGDNSTDLANKGKQNLSIRGPAHDDCNKSAGLFNRNISNKRHGQALRAPQQTNTTPSVVLPKRSNLSLIEPSEPAAIFKEIQGTEECIELHHEHAISKIQMVGNAEARLGVFNREIRRRKT